MLRDLRHAARMLVHAKGWTAVVIVSLALGIGANTAIFSAVNGMLLKKLSVEDPDSLVRLRFSGRNDMVNSSSDYGFSGRDETGRDIRATFSYAMYQQFRADNQTMTDLVACAPIGQMNVVVDGQAEMARGFLVSGNFFQVLGVRPTRGRLLMPDDDRANAPLAVVISDRYWRSRFGSDAAAIGKTVRLNNQPGTIVGVTAPEFTGVQQTLAEPPDVIVPVVHDPLFNPQEAERLRQSTSWWLQVLGRLKPGVTPAQVKANLEHVFRNTARAGLDAHLASLTSADRSLSRNQNRTEIPFLRVDSGSRGVYEVNRNDVRAASILGVVVALVLLIVCANVANLLLSRATARQKEISVRLAMGATRGRLIRQLLTESLLLAFMGGGLGIVVGYWGKQLLPGPPGQATVLDWRVLGFVVLVTTITGVIFGIAPALKATRMNVSGVLKETSRSVAGARSVLTKSLLVIQVAASLVLLIGAGLFLRTLQNLRQVDVGFNAHNLVVFRVNPALNRYDEKQIGPLYETLTQRLKAIPGVRSATLSQPGLLAGGVNTTSVFVHGRTYVTGQRGDSIHRLVIAPNFFETMEIPIVRGRAFNDADNTPTAPKVVIINEAAARKLFPLDNPLGRRIGQSPEQAGQLEIVGVLRDTKYNSVRDPAPPTMYVPFLQTRTFGPMVVVRTAGQPTSVLSAIRGAVREVDPNLPIMNMSTQADQIETRLQQERLFAQAYALFGVLALVVASVGLFGLMSYSVARRTNEMGIRVAIGAQRRDILRLVMSESMILVVAGVAIGLATAFGVSRYIENQLFGIVPHDEQTMLIAIGVMVVVAAIAGYLPARRAARVDPVVALRYE